MAARTQSVEQVAPDGAGPDKGSRRTVAVVVGGILVAAVAGFLVGSHGWTRVVELTGRADVGAQVATIQVDGTAYGLTQSVPWLDAFGSVNEGGWPSCLGAAGNTPIVHFGGMLLPLPDGGSIAVVAYVDCRP
jgi:hypothetical protein